jgi:hypothetical protein
MDERQWIDVNGQKWLDKCKWTNRRSLMDVGQNCDGQKWTDSNGNKRQRRWVTTMTKGDGDGQQL